MMKWFDRILTALRSAARDLISEDDEIEGDRIDTLIDAAQTRLTVLRDELAQAVAREKRAEIDWHAAWDQANALDTNVDRRCAPVKTIWRARTSSRLHGRRSKPMS